MWGLAEVATAEIVFCVPSFPILFRRGRPLNKLYRLLRLKITMILWPERFASGFALSHSPSATDTDMARENMNTWLDDGSDTGLTELEPVRIQAGRPGNRSHGGPELDFEGILITTEIDVRTQENQETNTGISKRLDNRRYWFPK